MDNIGELIDRLNGVAQHIMFHDGWLRADVEAVREAQTALINLSNKLAYDMLAPEMDVHRFGGVPCSVAIVLLGGAVSWSMFGGLI